jgi:hypothetical protein
MKKRKAMISNKKLRGEWAELCFMVRAAEHGLQISKPWGEMRSYDVVLGRPGYFVAVQVKSTICELGNGYDCTVRGGHTSYPPGSFDFLAAYAALEDVWYIIPEETIEGMESVTLYPNNKAAKYEKYREAWHLLKDRPMAGKKIDRIHACVDQTPAPEFPFFWVEVADAACN